MSTVETLLANLHHRPKRRDGNETPRARKFHEESRNYPENLSCFSYNFVPFVSRNPMEE